MKGRAQRFGLLVLTCAVVLLLVSDAQSEEWRGDKTWEERLGLPLPIAQQDFAEVCGANFARWLFAEEAEAKALLVEYEFRENRFAAERIADWLVEAQDVPTYCAITAFLVIDLKYRGALAEVMKAIVRKKQADYALGRLYQDPLIYEHAKQNHLSRAADTQDPILLRLVAQPFSEQISIYAQDPELKTNGLPAATIVAWLKDTTDRGIEDGLIGLFIAYTYGIGVEQDLALGKVFRDAWQKWRRQRRNE